MCAISFNFVTLSLPPPFLFQAICILRHQAGSLSALSGIVMTQPSPLCSHFTGVLSAKAMMALSAAGRRLESESYPVGARHFGQYDM